MWSRSWSGAFRYGSSALLPAGRRDQGVQAERGFAGTRNETKLTASEFSSSFWAEAPWSAPRGWPLSPAKQGRAASAASCALARGIVTGSAETHASAARGARRVKPDPAPRGGAPIRPQRCLSPYGAFVWYGTGG